jgi:hypothetical protein
MECFARPPGLFCEMTTTRNQHPSINDPLSQLNSVSLLYGTSAHLHPQFTDSRVALSAQADRIVWTPFMEAFFDLVDQAFI